jgi:hypothetical protein
MITVKTIWLVENYHSWIDSCVRLNVNWKVHTCTCLLISMFWVLKPCCLLPSLLEAVSAECVYWLYGVARRSQQFEVCLLLTTASAITVTDRVRVVGSVTLQPYGKIQHWGSATWCPHNLSSRLSLVIQTIRPRLTGMPQLPGIEDFKLFVFMWPIARSW